MLCVDRWASHRWCKLGGRSVHTGEICLLALCSWNICYAHTFFSYCGW